MYQRTEFKVKNDTPFTVHADSDRT